MSLATLKSNVGLPHAPQRDPRLAILRAEAGTWRSRHFLALARLRTKAAAHGTVKPILRALLFALASVAIIGGIIAIRFAAWSDLLQY